MSLLLFLVFDLTLLKQTKEFLEYKSILLIYGLPDGFGSKLILILLDHTYQSLHLFLVFLPNLFITFDLKLQTLGVIDPVDPLGPGYPIATLLKYLMKLLFSGCHFLLLRIDNQIVVLGEDGDEWVFFVFNAPG